MEQDARGREPADRFESGARRPTIFSPATKAETGHDQNVTVARMHNIVGAAVTAEPERLTRTS